MRRTSIAFSNAPCRPRMNRRGRFIRGAERGFGLPSLDFAAKGRAAIQGPRGPSIS